MVLLNTYPAKGPAMGREDAFFHYLPVNEETIRVGNVRDRGGSRGDPAGRTLSA